MKKCREQEETNIISEILSAKEPEDGFDIFRKGKERSIAKLDEK